MNFACFLETVKARCKPLEPVGQLIHAQLGMLGEAGEIADAVKRHVIYGAPLDTPNVLEEVGDWFWYFLLFCDTAGVSVAGLEKCQAISRLVEIDDASLDGLAVSLGEITGHFLRYQLFEDAGWVPDWLEEQLSAALAVVLCLLEGQGFTLEQCLDTNDKKLEKRSGKAFSATACLAKNASEERAVLEAAVRQA